VITTRELKFPLPGLDLVLEVVANVEDLVTDPEDDDQIPYWAELWPAARGLAQEPGVPEFYLGIDIHHQKQVAE
jgi:hypothetical protein